jgi:hypothetical protein
VSYTLRSRIGNVSCPVVAQLAQQLSNIQRGAQQHNFGSIYHGAPNPGARYGIICLEWQDVGLVRKQINEGQPLNTNSIKKEHQLQKTKLSKMTLNVYKAI